MSSGGGCFVYLIAGFLGGLWLVYNGAKTYQLLQKIRNTPTSKVEAAAVGMVELYGKARPKDGFVSPVSGVPCGFWRIIGMYWHSGKHSGWRKFYQKDSSSPFFLEDDTGKMLVDPAGAQVEIPSDMTYEGYISGKGVWGVEHGKIDERVLKFIDALDASGRNRFMQHQHLNVRVIEHFIADGDAVYVLGNAMPREGASSATGFENLIVKKGRDIMYVSDSGERKITDSLDGTVKWGVYGGLIVSAASLAILLLVLSAYIA